MKNDLLFHISVEEENGTWVWTVKENAVSSFGATEQEALDMTLEALKGWLECKADMEKRKIIELSVSRSSEKRPILKKRHYTVTSDSHARGIYA